MYHILRCVNICSNEGEHQRLRLSNEENRKHYGCCTFATHKYAKWGNFIPERQIQGGEKNANANTEHT